MTLGSPCMTSLQRLRPDPGLESLFRTLLSQKRRKGNRSAWIRWCDRLGETSYGVSGRREGVFDGFFGLAVRATGTAGLGAGAERFVDDGLDGAGAAAAFSA